MGKIIPLVLVLIGLAAGVGAGIFLRPSSEEPVTKAAAKTPTEMQLDYVKLNNQFVVPVIEDGQVTALVILALSLEVTAGGSEDVFLREPKLRDGMLQMLFDHANSGGFRGSFTDGSNLVILREALLEVAKRTLGEMVSDVLIVDIMRQDS